MVVKNLSVSRAREFFSFQAKFKSLVYFVKSVRGIGGKIKTRSGTNGRLKIKSNSKTTLVVKIKTNAN